MAITKHTIARLPKIATPRRAEHQPQRVSRCQSCSGAEISRRYIGLAIIALIAGSAVAGIWEPTALTILERLLPTLTLMCGYYYRQSQA